MTRSPKPMHPAFAVLAFVAAILSYVIYEFTETWPSEFDQWGSLVFVLVGIAILANYAIVRGQTDTETVEA